MSEAFCFALAGNGHYRS